MSRRSAAEVAANVAKTIADHDATPESVAQAADISIPELEDRLNGGTPFDLAELAGVGGFLHVAPHLFLEGVA